MTENERGMKKKINGGPALTNQVRDAGKGLKHMFLRIKRPIKYI